MVVTIIGDDSTDGTEFVTVAGRRMMFEIAMRGMDLDLYDEAKNYGHTPQAICDAYANLHFLRYDEEWVGYQAW